MKYDTLRRTVAVLVLFLNLTTMALLATAWLFGLIRRLDAGVISAVMLPLSTSQITLAIGFILRDLRISQGDILQPGTAKVVVCIGIPTVMFFASIISIGVYVYGQTFDNVIDIVVTVLGIQSLSAILVSPILSNRSKSGLYRGEPAGCVQLAWRAAQRLVG